MGGGGGGEENRRKKKKTKEEIKGRREREVSGIEQGPGLLKSVS